MAQYRLSHCLFAFLVVVGCGLRAAAVPMPAIFALSPQQQKQPTKQTPAPQQDEPNSSDDQKPDLSDQVISDVLEPLQRGMEGRSLEQVLAIFDKSGMPDYAQVRDNLISFFRQCEAIRFRYKVLQVTSEKDHGFAVVEIDMAATPADQILVPVQRTTQMRFQIKLGPKGWQVVSFKPGDFFNL